MEEVSGVRRGLRKTSPSGSTLPGIMESVEPFWLGAAHTEAPQGSKTNWAVRKTGIGLTMGLRPPQEEGE